MNNDMKTITMRLRRNALLLLAAFPLAACSSLDAEQEKPFTTCPEAPVVLFACEAVDETRGAAIDTLFTEDDIAWFDVSTRELRFKQQDEQLFARLMKNYHREGLEFRLGESVLFTVSRFVADFDSRIFLDLVLHYSTIGNDEDSPRYYLHDCYPPQFRNDERTQENIRKNAQQWETFTKYLESKGKLRK